MKVQAARADAFAKKPDPGVVAVLVYGPDSGLVRERADTLGRTVVEDLADPFRVALLTGAQCAADPPRLGDEAAAMALTGGRRLVRVRDAGDTVAPMLQGLLDAPRGDALVVLEAGELPPRSALRKLCEGAGNAAALPCYVDEGAAVERVLRETLAATNVTLARDAAAWMAQHMGGDRALLRREAEKLALYVGAGATATLEDCLAVVGDSAQVTLDALALAVTGGESAALGRLLDRAFAEGAQPISVLRAVGRHLFRLASIAAAIEAGAAPGEAVARLRPPAHFKVAPALEAQARRWTRLRLARAVERIMEAETQCKRAGHPPDLMCRAALTGIAALGAAARRAA